VNDSLLRHAYRRTMLDTSAHFCTLVERSHLGLHIQSLLGYLVPHDAPMALGHFARFRHPQLLGRFVYR
jgi:hypothetical protein